MTTKWGIISTGKISHDFTTALRSIPGHDHEILAVATRNLESAQEFADRHKIPQAYGSYEELAKNPDIEVAYIGTISTQHFPVGKLMLENGKHVLMEKPMTLNAAQTKELILTAKKNKRFLMEAIWSRFLPSYKCLMDLLEKRTIGDVVHVDASFGIPVPDVERRMKKSLGRGTIFNLGIYTLNAVMMVYSGEKPHKIAAVGHLNDDGMDIAMSSSLLYTNNRTANVTANALAQFPCDMVITGTRGQIKVPKPMWCPTIIQTPNETMEFPLPDTVGPCNFVNTSGLRYEAMEVRECIQKGVLESSIMPLKDSVALAEIMDEIRRQIGVVFDED